MILREANESESRKWHIIHPNYYKRKLIKVRCDDCRDKRIIREDAYTPLCLSCSRSVRNLSLRHRQNLSASKIGEKHPRWIGGWTEEYKKLYDQRYREDHTEEMAKYQKKYYKDHREEILEQVAIYQKTTNGKISTHKQRAKRRRELGYILILPLKDGEVGHHFTDEYVIGIPEEIHIRFSGYRRKKHRALIQEWLKENDKRKHKIVLLTVALNP